MVQETLIHKLMDAIGVDFFNALLDSIYGSGLFKSLIYLSAVAAVMFFGYAIHTSRRDNKPVMLVLALAAIYPVNGEPAGMAFAGLIGRLMASVVDEAALKALSSHGTPGESNNLPPGSVMGIISSAATAKLTDTDARIHLTNFVSKCLRGTLNTDGNPATFNDIFRFRTRYSYDQDSDRWVTEFIDKRLNKKSLANNTAYSSVIPGKNCEDGLKMARIALVNNIKGQSLDVMPRIVQGRDDPVTDEQWFENWKRQQTRLHDLAINTSVALAGDYERSKIIEKMTSDPLSGYYTSTQLNSSLRETMLALDSPAVSSGFQASNMSEMPSRILGNRWAFSTGAQIKDLKDKLELLPYHIGAVRNLLRFISIFAIMTLFFLSGARWYCTWFGSWAGIHILPSAVNYIRATHNTTILSQLGIQDFLDSNATYNYKNLAYGVDINLARGLIDDFMPMAFSLVSAEIKSISDLSYMILGGSLLVGYVGNGFVNWVSNSVMGMAVSQGAGLGGSILKAGTNKAYDAAKNSNFFEHVKNVVPVDFSPSNLQNYSLHTATKFPKEENRT